MQGLVRNCLNERGLIDKNELKDIENIENDNIYSMNWEFEREFVKEAFDTNWIAPLGPNVNEFEKELAEYVGVKSAAVLTSGTSAIHLAVKLLGVSKGDYVLCSSLTFCASCNPIVYEGAIPVFIDSEPESFNMSPKALKKALEDLKVKGITPKAAIVVNLYGNSANMDAIKELCDEYSVKIIEDAAKKMPLKIPICT